MGEVDEILSNFGIKPGQGDPEVDGIVKSITNVGPSAATVGNDAAAMQFGQKDGEVEDILSNFGISSAPESGDSLDVTVPAPPESAGFWSNFVSDAKSWGVEMVEMVPALGKMAADLNGTMGKATSPANVFKLLRAPLEEINILDGGGYSDLTDSVKEQFDKVYQFEAEMATGLGHDIAKLGSAEEWYKHPVHNIDTALLVIGGLKAVTHGLSGSARIAKLAQYKKTTEAITKLVPTMDTVQVHNLVETMMEKGRDPYRILEGRYIEEQAKALRTQDKFVRNRLKQTHDLESRSRLLETQRELRQNLHSLRLLDNSLGRKAAEDALMHHLDVTPDKRGIVTTALDSVIGLDDILDRWVQKGALKVYDNIRFKDGSVGRLPRDWYKNATEWIQRIDDDKAVGKAVRWLLDPEFGKPEAWVNISSNYRALNDAGKQMFGDMVAMVEDLSDFDRRQVFELVSTPGMLDSAEAQLRKSGSLMSDISATQYRFDADTVFRAKAVNSLFKELSERMVREGILPREVSQVREGHYVTRFTRATLESLMGGAGKKHMADAFIGEGVKEARNILEMRDRKFRKARFKKIHATTENLASLKNDVLNRPGGLFEKITPSVPSLVGTFKGSSGMKTLDTAADVAMSKRRGTASARSIAQKLESLGLKNTDIEHLGSHDIAYLTDNADDLVKRMDEARKTGDHVAYQRAVAEILMPDPTYKPKYSRNTYDKVVRRIDLRRRQRNKIDQYTGDLSDELVMGKKNWKLPGVGKGGGAERALKDVAYVSERRKGFRSETRRITGGSPQSTIDGGLDPAAIMGGTAVSMDKTRLYHQMMKKAMESRGADGLPDIVSPIPRDGWVPVKGKKRWGDWNGRWVHPTVYDDMSAVSNTIENMGATMEQLAKIGVGTMQTFKKGKLFFNLPTYSRNWIFNKFLLELADINPMTPSGLKAIRRGYKSFFDNDALLALHKQHGLYMGDFAQTELRVQLEALQIAEKTGRPITETIWEAMMRTVDTADVLGLDMRKFMDKLASGKYYTAVDAMDRHTIFVNELAKGADPAVAAAKARKYMLDYSNLPKLAKILRNAYQPFISFTWKAMPHVTKELLKRPFKLMKWGYIFDQGWDLTTNMSGMDTLSQNVRGESPEHQRSLALLADLKSMAGTHILPFSGRSKNDYLVWDDRNLNFLHEFFAPWGGLGIWQGLAPSHPLVSFAYTAISGKEPYFGWNVYNPNAQDAEEIATALGAYAWRMAVPQMAPGLHDLTLGLADKEWTGGWGFERWKAAIQGKKEFDHPEGRELTFGLMLLDQTMGIKVRQFKRSERWIRAAKNQAYRRNAIVTEYRKQARKYADDPEMRRRKWLKMREKLGNIRSNYYEKRTGRKP